MREARLKTWLGFYLVIAHLAIMGLVVALFLARGFLLEEMSTCLGMLAPTFTVYTGAIITFITQKRHERSASSREVNRGFVVLAFLFPTIFLLALVAFILLKAFNLGFSSFEQFKVVIVATQAAVGAHAGYLIVTLFELPQAKAAAESQTTEGGGTASPGAGEA